MIKKKLWVSILAIGLVMAIEKPEYKVLEKYGKIEIRKYNSMVIAVTQVQKPYKSALNTGFRRIANYIFGGNSKEMNIAMTAPVVSTQINSELETHEVFFVLPREHKFNELPQPTTKNVQIKERELSKVAAIKFGGWATQIRVNKYQNQLKNKLSNLGFDTSGNFMVAQYNSPWAIPPFRKNEILIQIK